MMRSIFPWHMIQSIELFVQISGIYKLICTSVPAARISLVLVRISPVSVRQQLLFLSLSAVLSHQIQKTQTFLSQHTELIGCPETEDRLRVFLVLSLSLSAVFAHQIQKMSQMMKKEMSMRRTATALQMMMMRYVLFSNWIIGCCVLELFPG